MANKSPQLLTFMFNNTLDLKKIKGLFFPISLALTIASGLEPLLLVSKFAKLTINYWKDILSYFWDTIFGIFSLDLGIEIYEPLTVAILFFLAGLTCSRQYLEFFKKKNIPKVGKWISLLTYTFNATFFSVYTLVKYQVYSNIVQNCTNCAPSLGALESYLIGLSFCMFIVTIGMALPTLLFRKIIYALFSLILIICLDQLYAPLEKFIN